MLKQNDLKSVDGPMRVFDGLEIDAQLVGPASDGGIYREVDLLISGSEGDVRRELHRLGGV